MRSKASRKIKKKIVLAYDLGGTKVAAGVVREDGKIIRQTRVLVDFESGPNGVLDQLAAIGRLIIDEFPDIKCVGIASAGPLDPAKGLLLDPTNMFTGSTSWGVIPIATVLKKKLKRKIVLENDAAAAVLAEKWMGAAKKSNNAIVLTLGTGVGVGVICNGSLVRAGRGLHPEASHLILGHQDQSAPCGCGNLGCIEAYLSGKNFAARASSLHLGKDLDARAIAELARKGDVKALKAFEDYVKILAATLSGFVALFALDLVVFTGSFADVHDLFLP